MILPRKRKKRKKMKKFKISLTISDINASDTNEAEERLRCFVFKGRPNWKLDILEISRRDGGGEK